jgi:hypothetical protein
MKFVAYGQLPGQRYDVAFAMPIPASVFVAKSTRRGNSSTLSSRLPQAGESGKKHPFPPGHNNRSAPQRGRHLRLVWTDQDEVA